MRARGDTLARWRAVAAGPAVALLALVAALVTTRAAGIGVRDPDHVAAQYVMLVGLGVVGLVGLDVVLRAWSRAGSLPPPRRLVSEVRRERWTRGRCGAVAAAVAGFYLTYFAYRNLKGVVPLLDTGDLYDARLARVDRALLGGHEPARLLHDLLGTGIASHVLSGFYVAFIVFLPLTIGVALVFSRDLRSGLLYTTAQSINWLVGAASYFLLPSLGPVYAHPAQFAGLAHSEVTHLQSVLMDQRLEFLRDPAHAAPQAVAAFASLHISMSFTAALAAQLLGAGRRLRIALWGWLAVTTVGTLYLGWHYLVDDLGGLLLGAAALTLASAVTGISLRGRHPAGDRRLAARPARGEPAGVLGAASR